MDDRLWFLEYLKLNATANRRDIKRSYARLLKSIDKKTEIQAFQRLREAYEISLLWVESSAVDVANELSEDGLEHGAKSPQTSDANEEKENAFQEKEEKREEANPDLTAYTISEVESSALVEAWKKEVRELQISDAVPDEICAFITRFFRNEKLINLETREYFEFFVAQFILEISPSFRGHLLVQCANFFLWTDAPSHLHRTPAGEWVLYTLEERDAWLSQETHILNAQKRALHSYMHHAFTPKRIREWSELAHIRLAYPNWFGCWIHDASFEEMNQRYSFNLENTYDRDLDNYSFYGRLTSHGIWSNLFWLTVLIGVVCKLVGVILSSSSVSPAPPLPQPQAQIKKKNKARVRRLPLSKEYFKSEATPDLCQDLRTYLSESKNALAGVLLHRLDDCMKFDFWPNRGPLPLAKLWQQARTLTRADPGAKKNSVLAYEFRPPNDIENCRKAYIFSWSTHWAQTKDLRARDKFERYVLTCVNKGFWPGGAKEAIAYLVIEITKSETAPILEVNQDAIKPKTGKKNKKRSPRKKGIHR